MQNVPLIFISEYTDLSHTYFLLLLSWTHSVLNGLRIIINFLFFIRGKETYFFSMPLALDCIKLPASNILLGVTLPPGRSASR